MKSGCTLIMEYLLRKLPNLLNTQKERQEYYPSALLLFIHCKKIANFILLLIVI